MLNGALYERTSILTGADGLRRLQQAHVLVVGVGGVGGHCAEALVRSGVGSITICDHDVVSLTNKNRQLSALDSTVGQSKARILANRFVDINRACRVTVVDAFLMPEDIPEFLERDSYDCVVDCIDSLECKIALVAAAARRGICIFVSGGAGGRVDPAQVQMMDIFDTENDGLLRRMRGELRKFGVGPCQVECVASKEIAKPPLPPAKQEAGGRDRAINGTMSYLPPMFGLILSSRVIQFLLDPAKYRSEKAAELKRRTKKEHAAEKEEAEARAKRQEVYKRREDNWKQHQVRLQQQKQQEQHEQEQPSSSAAAAADDGRRRDREDAIGDKEKEDA